MKTVRLRMYSKWLLVSFENLLSPPLVTLCPTSQLHLPLHIIPSRNDGNTERPTDLIIRCIQALVTEVRLVTSG